MEEFYSQIKLAHVGTVLLSGAVFLVRGVLVQSGRQHWALCAPVRFGSYTIDTALLVAGLLLLAILPGAAYANGWLAAKLVLLPVYIVLGSFALKRARTRRIRLWYFLAALLTYGFMLTIAWSHHPLGLFSVWLGGDSSGQNLAA
jgi:uncharacterized membrane protein SirB2